MRNAVVVSEITEGKAVSKKNNVVFCFAEYLTVFLVERFKLFNLCLSVGSVFFCIGAVCSAYFIAESVYDFYCIFY